MHSSERLCILQWPQNARKWVEAKVVRTYTTTNDAENIISRFGCPHILVSYRGSHSLDNMIKTMIKIGLSIGKPRLSPTYKQ